MIINNIDTIIISIFSDGNMVHLTEILKYKRH